MQRRWLFCFWNWQIERLRAHVLAISAGGIKMSVIRNDVALVAHHIEKDSFRRAALMSRDDMLKTHDGLDRITKARKARRASVGLVTAHHGGPLFGRHRGCSRIREQVNEDRFRSHQK